MTDIAFYACDAVTGQIIEEFTDLVPNGSLSRRISDHTSCSFTLPVPIGGSGRAPRNWEGATEPGRSMLVAVWLDHPIWAGIILRRRGGHGSSVNFDCASFEAYLTRRYTFDQTYEQVDEAADIVFGLVQSTNVEHGVNLEIDAPPTGVIRTRHYFDYNDKTIFSALEDLTNINNGVEWTIDLDWTNANRTSFTKIFRARKQLGRRAPGPTGSGSVAPNQAAAIFDTQANTDVNWEFVEDYSEGKGANHIIAVSSGEGDERPQSTPARELSLLDAGFPQYEFRFTPSSSITNINTLINHSHARRTLIARGARTLELSARANVYPLLHTDWQLGDDVLCDLIGGRFPNGFKIIARVIAWELDVTVNKVFPKVIIPPIPVPEFVVPE